MWVPDEITRVHLHVLDAGGGFVLDVFKAESF
jgi:hypothetical protein